VNISQLKLRSKELNDNNNDDDDDNNNNNKHYRPLMFKNLF